MANYPHNYAEILDLQKRNKLVEFMSFYKNLCQKN